MSTASSKPKLDTTIHSDIENQTEGEKERLNLPVRRKLKFTRKLIILGAFAFGFLTTIASLGSFIEQEDLIEISGEVIEIEEVKYWEDFILYLRVEGASGRFKYEKGNPGYDDFKSRINKGVPVHLWVESIDNIDRQPARIFAADVNGERIVRFEETQPVHNQESFYIMLMGGGFCLLGLWIWHRSTRPLPTSEESDAYEKYLIQRAEQHPHLFIVVHIITKIRGWGESIPQIGDLFTAFLFFWILPLYMLFIYVTAYSYHKLVSLFCFSYWVVLVGLIIGVCAFPDFPGGNEYPALGQMGSKLFSAYLILNIAYGGAIWIWGTLMYEEESDNPQLASKVELTHPKNVN